MEIVYLRSDAALLEAALRPVETPAPLAFVGMETHKRRVPVLRNMEVIEDEKNPWLVEKLFRYILDPVRAVRLNHALRSLE